MALRLNFELDARHVDAGGAIAFAALAADAQIERLLHGLAGQRVGAELAR